MNPHAVGGQIAIHAIQVAAGVDPGDPNPPVSVARVFFFGMGAASLPRSVWESEGGYYNDVFIDTTDVAFDDFAGGQEDVDANRRILGLS